MPDQEGEILLHGSYAQLTDQLFLTKSIQQMIKWYSQQEENATIISRSGNVKRNDKVTLILYFLEERPKLKTGAIILDKSPRKHGVMSLRLMEYESPTRKNEIIYTKEQFIPLAEKVKAQLATPPVVWKKGKKLYSYTNWKKGVQFQVNAENEASARTVINACLDVRGFTFETECFNLVQSLGEGSRYPDTKDSITLLGQKRYFKNERPIVPVTFRWAKLYFPTINENFWLYDRRNKQGGAILKG